MNKRSAGDFLNSLFVFFVVVEMTVFPILYLGEYAFGLGYGATYFLRYIYILYVIIALFSICVRFRIHFNLLSALLLFSLVIGLIRSAFVENDLFSLSAFFSHVFYFVMPIVSMSFGVQFYEYSSRISKAFSLWVKRLALFGFVVILCFYASRFVGFSPYDSVDIWNSLIGVSYLMPTGGWVFYLAVISIALAQKRTAIAVSLIVFFAFISSKYKIRYTVFFTLIGFLLIFILTQVGTGLDRVDSTIIALKGGDFRFAFSGRVEEAMQVVKELSNESFGSVAGLGLGIQYYPWPEIPGNEDYVSHSAHIGFFSYALVVGYPMAAGIFILISLYTSRIVRCLIKNNLRNHEIGLMLLFIAFLLASLVGGSMVNNPLFWILLGTNIQILRCIKGSYRYDGDM
jgi:hypothetical protein